jgi:hypothetical protein
MPIRKPWDHAIDLKETFKPKKGRLIPLSPEEQKEVSDFIDDQLSKKYIRSSKSEQTSPVFFVPKKDGQKANGTGLLLPKRTHSEESLPITIDLSTR